METEVIKMIKQPSYRFAGYTEPWEEKKLGEVAEVNPKSVVPDEFKYVDLGAVVGTEMVSYRNETISTSPSRAQRLAIKGDIFYQTVRPYQKNNYLFEKDDNDYVFSTGYAQLRPSGDGCFLLSYLQTNKFVNVVLDNCTGTSYPAINSKDLSDIFISLPSLSEQTAIGSFFQDIDQLISLQQRKLEVLKEQKKTYLKLLFPAKGQTKPDLRFAGFEDEWKEVKLGEVTDIKTGGRDVQDSVEDGLYPFYIRSEEVKRINSYSFDGEAILIPGEGRLGEIFHYANGKFDVHQRVYKISNFTDANAKFVLQQMKKDFKQHAMRNTVKATVDSLRLPTIQSFNILVPSLPEQTAIGSFFQNLDNAITKQEEKINQLKESKQTLLKKMFI